MQLHVGYARLHINDYDILHQRSSRQESNLSKYIRHQMGDAVFSFVLIVGDMQGRLSLRVRRAEYRTRAARRFSSTAEAVVTLTVRTFYFLMTISQVGIKTAPPLLLLGRAILRHDNVVSKSTHFIISFANFYLTCSEISHNLILPPDSDDNEWLRGLLNRQRDIPHVQYAVF